ncbi:hypothetical protein ACQQ2N_12190 [Dokdonella sp. MW10]|uniref:hypothetical protein n=1 Tax=Dokdonella sp. MW10 TaxID=2992926 RepID=UPI003F7F44E7
MARPRTATNVLELKGAFKKNPKRAKDRKDEPVALGDIGPPPAKLKANVRRCWDEIVGLCHAGTLCPADRLIVEHAARLLAQLRAEGWLVHPTILIRFEASLGKLGLTPADRSKVQVKKAPPKNQFDES